MTRILLADSDPIARKALTLLLNRKLGLTEIFYAADLQLLESQLAACRPDVLLVEASMLGRPGGVSCRWLRQNYPALRLALLSINPEDALCAAELGAVFIDKSSNGERVLEQVRSLLA
jgi:DNA-binding NarL/FixJ family response regulator